jgi:hypothetical protein
MKPSFRASSPADAPAIAALISEVLGHSRDHPSVDPRMMHWKYWLERSDYPGTRSFVLARGPLVLAHAGLVPGTAHSNGTRQRTAHLIDWVARAGAIGAGASLLKHISRANDSLIAIGGSPQTRAILPALGFKADGEAVGFVRCLRPWRRLMGEKRPSLRLASQVGRSMLWTATASARYAGHWKLRRLAASEIDGAALPLPAARPDIGVFERSAALFKHLAACPKGPMALYQADRLDGRASGYFVLAFAPGQARLADFWVDPPEPANWRALVQLAVQASRRDHREAAELVTLSNDRAISRVLVDCGFHARMKQPLLSLAMTSCGLRNLRVQMLENDFAWMHSGEPDFWA